jgi:hypothetical protein
MNRFMGTSLGTGAPILFFEGRDWKSFRTASVNTGHTLLSQNPTYR